MPGCYSLQSRTMNAYQESVRGVFLVVLCITTCVAYINFPIGAIFDRRETEVQKAFRFAISHHNTNSSRQAVNLSAMTASVDSANGFELSKAICNEMAHGIFYILGTKNLKTTNVLQSYTNTFHMPYLTTGPVPNFVPYNNDFILHLRPSITAAMVDLIRDFDWSALHYVYDSYEGLLRLEEIISTFTADDSFSERLNINSVEIIDINRAHDVLRNIDGWKITRPLSVDVDQLDSQQKKIVEMKQQQEEMFPMRIIILDISTTARLQLVLRQLQEMGMNRPRYHYIIASLDIEEVEMTGFLHSGVNITGFRLIEQDNPFIQTVIKQWESYKGNSWQGGGQLRLAVDVGLVVDAISLMLNSLLSLMDSNHEKFRRNFRRGKLYNSNNSKILCSDQPKPWEHGPLLIEEVKKTSMQGLTGRVAFGYHGYRTGYKLDILTLVEKAGLRKVGVWNDIGGADSRMKATDGNWRELKRTIEYEEKTYIVTTIPTDPFIMVKEYDDDGKPLIGNDRFMGYCADLVMAVAKQLKFHYIIRPVADRKYGAKDHETGRWNGMIGELIDQKADIAVAPLTITSIRERVVDFSKPYMNLGISIMIKKPEKSKPGVFSFLSPFSQRLWISITAACVAVGAVLFGVGRVSPYQWDVKQSPGEDPDVSTEITLMNCLWFSLGALMSQGGDVTLRAMSTRLVGSVWSLFTLIVISSYTANLAAFLTIERMVTPINSVNELAGQTKIAYGTLAAGSTQGFFSGSNVSVYKTMWRYMEAANPTVFVNKTEEGINRVRNSKGRYAFLLESTENDYANQRKPCNTMKVGDNLDSKGYGMAVQMGNPLRKRLNLAVLKLHEDATLHELKKRWWYDKSECLFEDEGSSSNPLTLSNVAGIFYILIAGFGLAMFVSLMEYCHRSRKDANKRQTPTFDATRFKIDTSVSGCPSEDSRTAMCGPQNGMGGLLSRRYSAAYSAASPNLQRRTGAISLV